MEKLIKGVLLLLIASFLVSCVSFYYPLSTPARKEEYLVPFDSIVIRGAVDVQLDSRERPIYFVRVTGIQSAVENVQIKVERGVLYITSRQALGLEQANTRLNIFICSNGLKKFIVKGKGKVDGTLAGHDLVMGVHGSFDVNLGGQDVDLRKLNTNDSGTIKVSGIRSRCLDIFTRGEEEINLTGVMRLNKVNHRGSGNISAYWVDSPYIRVRSQSSGSIFLAGVGGVLNAELSKDAKLDAKYLRVHKAFINTINSSAAEITVSDSLNAFAVNESNIYYYMRPKLIGKYMRNSGSVLFMGAQPPPCLKPFCTPVPAYPG